MKKKLIYYFNKLEQLYSKIDKTLPKYEYNVCGKCYICCTHKINYHAISKLEFDYMEYKLKGNKELLNLFYQFKEYIDEKNQKKKNKKYKICPFYDIKNFGCRIYPYRAYAGRTYGPFLSEEGEAADICYFKDKAIYYNRENIKDILPYYKEFKELILEYESNTEIKFSYEKDQAYQNEKSILEKNTSRAIKYYEMKLKEEPDNYNYMLSLAKYYKDNNQIQKAEYYFKKAVNIAPNISLNHFFLGLFLYEQKRYKEAQDYLKKSIDINPDNSPAFMILSSLYYRLKEYKNSLKYIDEAIKIDPTYENNKIFKILILLKLKRFNEIKKYIKEYKLYKRIYTFIRIFALQNIIDKLNN